MKRFTSLALVSALATATLTSVAHASPVNGLPCTKVGSVQGLPNHRFICTQSGKKNIWRPYVAAATTKASSATKANTTSSGSSASHAQPTAPTHPIPITLPVAPVGSVTFDNVVSNYAQIPQQAYDNVQKAIQSGSDSNVPINVIIGPKTTSDTIKSVITSAIQRELKEFTGFSTPKAYLAIAYTAADEKWAEAEWVKQADALHVPQGEIDGRKSQVQNGCNMQNGVATECYGGLSFSTNNTDIRFVFYGVQGTQFWSANPPDYNTATQVNHEFTHVMQTAQFNGNPLHAGDNVITDTQHRSYPCWLNEGQANEIGMATFIPDLQNYLTVRDRTVTTPGPMNPGATLPISDYSAASITKFLTTQQAANGPDSPGCYMPGTGTYSLGYSVGMAATEALVAIGGPQSTLALLARTADGDSFATAFQTVYGIPWTQGATVLGQVVAAEYAAKPMQNR